MEHVARDYRIFGVGQDAFQLALRGGFEGGVDFFSGRCAVEKRYQIHYRDVRRGNSHGVSVELAFQLRHNQADGFGGSGGGGDHVARSSTGAPQVLMGEVQDVLIVGITVDRGHGPFLNSERVVEHLNHGGQTVSSARGIRDDVMPGGVVHIVIDAQHDGDSFIFGRGGDDDFLYRTANVLAGLFGVGESASGLDDNLCADGIPVELARIFFREDLDLFAADGDRVGVRGDLFVQGAEHRIVFQQMSQRLRIGDVVNCYELHIVAAEARAADIAADPAQA